MQQRVAEDDEEQQDAGSDQRALHRDGAALARGVVRRQRGEERRHVERADGREEGGEGDERGFDHGRHAEGKSRRILAGRSEEHTSELQSLMRISYAVFCLKKKTKKTTTERKHKAQIQY